MGDTLLHELSPQEVSTMMSRKACLLIDVREPGEYEAERIPNALLFPLSQFDAAALPFDGERRVILHCGAGKRSEMAAKLAHAAGVREVTHMRGGVMAWKAAGLPMIAFDPSTGASAAVK